MKSLVPAILVGLLGLTLAGCVGNASGSVGSANPGMVAPANRVVVYYMHRTLRCISCLSIEKETRRTLSDAFASELAAGQVEFHSEDYWMNEALTARYGVDTVSVIVVVVTGGREASHENLERVWQLKGRPEELRTYIAQAVRNALAKTSG